MSVTVHTVRVRSRGGVRTAAVAVACAAVVLSGCSVTTSDRPAVTPVNPLDPSPSGSSGAGSGVPAPSTAGPDLQLRPVLDVVSTTADQCPDPAPATPPAKDGATLCSQDGKLLFTLAPAVVSGERVTSIEAGSQDGTAIVRIKLDTMGGTALSNATLAGSQTTAPRSLLAIVSHGRVQAAPDMRDQIDGGVLDLTGFADAAAAQRAVDFVLG